MTLNLILSEVFVVAFFRMKTFPTEKFFDEKALDLMNLTED